MKNFFRVFLVFCLAVICLTAFSACDQLGGLFGGDTTTTESVTTTEPVTTTTPVTTAPIVSEGPTGVEIELATLTLDGNAAGATFPHATDSFSFNEEIKVAEGAKYVVSSDEYGRDTFFSKSVPLREGNNIFYVFVENGSEIKTYVFTLRRRPMYTVYFDPADGTAPLKQKVEEGSTATVPAPPSRLGYEFSGWNASTKAPIESDKTFVAKWRPIEYSITYTLNGGIDVTANPTTYTIEDEITLAEPTRAGYVFVGWKAEDRAVSGISKGNVGNKTFVAEWEAIFTRVGDTITGLTSLGKTLTVLTIPSSIDGYAINAIASDAFYECENLESVTIEEGVMSIGGWAFGDCESLESIMIPNSVIRIDADAFYGCEVLQYNTYEGARYLGNRSNPYLLLVDTTDSAITSLKIHRDTKYIGADAFEYCKKLTDLTLPNGLIGIGDYAFYACRSLESITIPDSVISIGYKAFCGCWALTTVTFAGESRLLGIDEDVFSDCEALQYNTYDNARYLGSSENPYLILVGAVDTSVTSVTIHTNTKHIAGGAFEGCKELVGIAIPSGVASIGDSAFYGCTKLTSITIPNGITKIGAYMFYGCESLGSVTIPNSVTDIGSYAFYGCERLTSITIPSNVTRIGAYAFYRSGLSAVVFKNTAGWHAEDLALLSLSLVDTSTATRYLCSIYYAKTWIRQ